MYKSMGDSFKKYVGIGNGMSYEQAEMSKTYMSSASRYKTGIDFVDECYFDKYF